MVKLFIVDDHTIIRKALIELLSSEGQYEVCGEAGSGEELLALLQQQVPDVIVMDLGMPGMGGVAAIEQIRARGLEVPILVLSAEQGQHSVRAAMQAGARGFVPKNAGSDEFKFAINAVLEGKVYLSPSVTAALMPGGGGDLDLNSPLTVLTKREQEILKHLADGKSNREISEILHISVRTVDTHRGNILKKLALKNNAELVKFAISCGLIAVK